MATHYVLEGEIKAEQPLATCSAALKEAEGGKGKPIPVPHMPDPGRQPSVFPGYRDSRQAAPRFA